MALSDRVQTNAQDMVRMEEQLQQFELDLVISQEKHRTCQQEVRTRPSISLSSSHTSNFASATLYCPVGQFVPVEWSVCVCVAGEQPRPGHPEAASGAGHESAEVHWSPGGG